MSTDAEAGHEILLGNRQLLSIFIIVIILLVAFFTMGYVLGKSTAGSVAADRVPATTATPSGFGTAQGTRETPAPAAPATPPPAAATSIAETAKPQDPVRAPLAPASAARSTEPAAGQVFLQVAAVKGPDAELVSAVLRKKGFRTLVAPGPTETVFRVLVGPLPDAEAIAKTRAGLSAVGFKSLLKKY